MVLVPCCLFLPSPFALNFFRRRAIVFLCAEHVASIHDLTTLSCARTSPLRIFSLGRGLGSVHPFLFMPTASIIFLSLDLDRVRACSSGERIGQLWDD